MDLKHFRDEQRNSSSSQTTVSPSVFPRMLLPFIAFGHSCSHIFRNNLCDQSYARTTAHYDSNIYIQHKTFFPSGMCSNSLRIWISAGTRPIRRHDQGQHRQRKARRHRRRDRRSCQICQRPRGGNLTLGMPSTGLATVSTA